MLQIRQGFPSLSQAEWSRLLLASEVSLAACGHEWSPKGCDVISSPPQIQSYFPCPFLRSAPRDGINTQTFLLLHPFCCSLILNPYQINYTSANCLSNMLFSGTQPVKVLTERKRKRKRIGKKIFPLHSLYPKPNYYF